MSDILLKSKALISFSEVQSAIQQEATLINSCIKEQQRENRCKDVVAITLLNGGIIFAGMLLPLLDFNLQLDSVAVSRYGKNDVGGSLSWHAMPRISLQNKTVLLLDDIFDQGLTLFHVRQWCMNHGAESVFSCVLAWKELSQKTDGQPDFYAVRIPDKFVVGMGMDYAGLYRNAPGIFVLPEKT